MKYFGDIESLYKNNQFKKPVGCSKKEIEDLEKQPSSVGTFFVLQEPTFGAHG